MGGTLSRVGRRLTSAVLGPLKSRGYLLTAAERRALRPTYFDKIASGAYRPSEVKKMKLRHRDQFLALRRALLRAVPRGARRSRYMERFFTERRPPRPTRLGFEARSVTDGTGHGGVATGSSGPPRLVSMDDVRSEALSDPRGAPEAGRMPVTLRRRRLNLDGTVVEYDTPEAVERWWGGLDAARSKNQKHLSV